MTRESHSNPTEITPEESREVMLSNVVRRMIDTCSAIESDMKQPMREFATGALSYATGMWSAPGEEVNRTIEASHLLLRTTHDEPEDKAARIVIARLSPGGNKIIPEHLVEGIEGSPDFLVRHYPLRLKRLPVVTEILRFMYTDTKRVKYVIQKEA